MIRLQKNFTSSNAHDYYLNLQNISFLKNYNLISERSNGIACVHFQRHPPIRCYTCLKILWSSIYHRLTVYTLQLQLVKKAVRKITRDVFHLFSRIYRENFIALSFVSDVLSIFWSISFQNIRMPIFEAQKSNDYECVTTHHKPFELTRGSARISEIIVYYACGDRS